MASTGLRCALSTVKSIPVAAAISALSVFSLTAADAEWQPLFNGLDLAGWTVTLENGKPGEDPEKFVQVHDGAIHMYRDTPAGRKSPFGIITHEREFSRFQIRFEYRWGVKRFEPRAEKLRDAGLLYHVKDPSVVWPASIECQVQEGDTGDLIFIKTGGLTWMRHGKSEDKTGGAGLLPENGGIPRLFQPSWPYIGDLEEVDSRTEWNRVEVTVHAGDYAEHVVNGRTLIRLGRFLDEEGEPLSSGKICLQLEGAEILYRNIAVRELDPPVSANTTLASFSAVRNQPARQQVIHATNPGTQAVSGVSLIGSDAAAFRILSGPKSIEPGAAASWTLDFQPNRGAGRYSAGLKIGDAAEGAFVLLQGIGLDAFEGKNEPPLQDIVHALGIPLDVGGGNLELDTKAPVIGEGTSTAWFTASDGGKIRITPLARFSPPGATPVGFISPDNDSLREIGKLSDSGSQLPDAHQCLTPPFADGSASIEIEPPAGKFGFYMQGHHYISFTDPKRPTTAQIPHTARIYPVRHFQGKALENAWLVGFEEAANGDYQDAVLLVEGVKPVE